MPDDHNNFLARFIAVKDFGSTVLVLFILLFALLLTGCGGGGGGGGGGGSGGAPAQPDVVIGTVHFNPATSQNFSAHALAWDEATVWNFGYAEGNPPPAPTAQYDQRFAAVTVPVGSGTLPAIEVAYPAPGGTSASAATRQWWAVSTDGSMYQISSTAASPAILSAPFLILPAHLTVAQTWSNGISGSAHADNAVDTAHNYVVVSLDATSPEGFLHCVQLHTIDPTGASSDPDTDSYEWWQPGHGFVEREPTTPMPTDQWFWKRLGLSASG